MTAADPSGGAGPPTEVEPDYRFTLANERTFLAWQRTALGLVAGGVALDEFARSVLPSRLTSVLAVVAVVLGAAVAALGLRRWAASQRAMRRGEPLPPARAVPALAVVLALVAVAVAVGMVLT